jgi:hypothetical protein
MKEESIEKPKTEEVEKAEAIWKESDPLIKDTLAKIQEALEATSETEKLARVKIEEEEYKIEPWIRIEEGKITRIELSSGRVEKEVKGEKIRGRKRYEFVDREDMKGFMYDLSLSNERGLVRESEHGSVYYAPEKNQFLIDNPELSQSQLKKIHEAFKKKKVEFFREKK